MITGPKSSAAPGGVVHMFPGQGDFSLTPLLRILPRVPALARAVVEVFDEADTVAAEFGVTPIGPRLAGGRVLSAGVLAGEPPGTVQLALFGVSMAVHRAFEADGFRADRILAVSFGEIPALAAAGSCSIPDGARLACRLGQLLTGAGGGMTLLGAAEHRARRLMAEAGPGAGSVVVACVNHAGETVLSGSPDGLAAVESSARRRGVVVHRLRLPFMSHHPALAREAGAFAHYARQLHLGPPQRPVYSAVAGRFHRRDTDLPRALSACLVRAFALPEVIGPALVGASQVLEAGTGRTLTTSVRLAMPHVVALAPVFDGGWPTAGTGGHAGDRGRPSPPDLARRGPGGQRGEGVVNTGQRDGHRRGAADVVARLTSLLPPGRGDELGKVLAEDPIRDEPERRDTEPGFTEQGGAEPGGEEPGGPARGGPADLRTDTRAHRRLTRLAALLPPAAEVVADAELLAALGEATVLADPPLYQTFLSHYTLCVGSLVLLGGEEADPSGALAHARTKGSFLVTEIGEAGSHLGIRTEARFDVARRAFVLRTPDERAAKFSSVAAAGLPQQAVVCARLLTQGRDGGVFSFLVDITGAEGRPAPGVSISAPVAVDALPLPYGLVRFDGVRVPVDRWLADGATIDDAGVLHDPSAGPDARLRRTLSCGQGLWATLPSAMAAMAGRSAAMAWRFSAGRRTHGRLAPGVPVLEYRTQQHAVIGGLAEAYALRCTARAALAAWAAGRAAGPADRPETAMTFSPWAGVDRVLALYKAYSTRSVAELIDGLQHRCGVSGFFDGNRFAGYLGFARAFDNAGGDNTLILLDAGRALVEERPVRPADAAREPSDLNDLNDLGDPNDLSEPLHVAWWPHVVATLQDRLADDLAAAHAAGVAAGRRALDLWNPLLADALDLGDVLACRLAADAAAGGVVAAGADGPGWTVPLADDLAALAGLRRARRLAGPLLAAGVLAPATVRAFPAATDALCDRLRPVLPDIVDALDPGRGLALSALDRTDHPAALLDAHGPRDVDGCTLDTGP
ncbi:acyltransferase domain-containing protein [Streptomyces sp. BE20]|uniref:acyl-CoA dehydrogenase family protein n=1 Tax=Streptomyces sp. BE20 TaxID=3002525 RepID=UPI002E75AC23|nr:acyltransferase domain-containing protein [Streptomyces sp. BE20]MEE1822640.1 acyltransferase domain-containing protein [Streptomyces sp. BE20]